MRKESAMASAPVPIPLTLCDHVLIEQGTSKISLIGSFTTLKLRPFPAVAPPFFVFALLTDTVGDVTMELKLGRLDTGAEVTIHRSRLTFPDKLVEVLYRPRLAKLVFPVPTTYQFTLLADGQWVAHRRLRIVDAEEVP
jgi:hypothetical protein